MRLPKYKIPKQASHHVANKTASKPALLRWLCVEDKGQCDSQVIAPVFRYEVGYAAKSEKYCINI